MLKINTEFQQFPKLTPGQISLLTRSVASQVRKAIKKATPKDSGAARKSWTPVRKDSGGYTFGSDLPYTRVLQYGSKLGKRPWPSAGPKTSVYQGRVFSSQAPEGITKRANFDKVVKQISDRLFKEWSARGKFK